MDDKKDNKLPISILVFIISLTPVNAVLYTPALPKLTTYLNISKSQAQYTIAYFLIGYALSQIVFGVLANYLGRRRALLIGLNLGLAASFLSIVACIIKNYDLLLYSRFLVGFGTAAGLIITYAMVNDAYSGAKARKVMSYIVMSFAVAPGVANLAGGFLTESNPIYCFYFLFLYNMIALVLVAKLIKKEISNKQHFKFINFFKEYCFAFVDRKIVIPALIYGLFAALLYSIVSILPFIAIQSFHFTSQTFGILFFLTYFGYLLGSMTASSVSHKLNHHQGMFVGIIIAVIAETTLISLTIYNMANAWILFTCIFFILFSLPFIFVNASVLGVSHHKNKSTASSALNFINIGTACVTVFICGMIKNNYLENLGYILIALTLIAMFLLIIISLDKISIRLVKRVRVAVRD
jgi:MFS family permease